MLRKSKPLVGVRRFCTETSSGFSPQQGREVDPPHPGKMGSKQIAQETFDDAVQENITEFEMDPEEAVREAVQQFESQGITVPFAGWAFTNPEV